MPRGEMMNRIEETSNEFEYSSGWKKIIRDKSKDRINEELRERIEELEKNLREFGSSITDLSKKGQESEKLHIENMGVQQMIIKKTMEIETTAKDMESRLEVLEREMNEYKKLLERDNYELSCIIENLKARKEIEPVSQKSFLANIFKKK